MITVRVRNVRGARLGTVTFIDGVTGTLIDGTRMFISGNAGISIDGSRTLRFPIRPVLKSSALGFFSGVTVTVR